MAVTLAHNQGHDFKSIARTFGYSSEKAASNDYYNTKHDLLNAYSDVSRHVDLINEKLSLSE